MLKDKRKELINFIIANQSFLNTNAEASDIYEGNLLPYVDRILKKSLSENYYNAIKDRILPINVLQKYINKVATAYSKPPKRDSENYQDFVDYYVKKFSMNQSGMVADQYSNLFKGFAWEPYIDSKGKPAIRELSFDKFLVYSDSEVSPEEETIFLKLMGKKGDDMESMLVFAYTDTEFDAFYLDGSEASEYLVENQGLNSIGVIPFVYGKRQKNKLLPTLDSDMLAITKAIPVMLTDAEGAQMFQCFSILYGIDVNADNIKMSPNAFWSLKSDPSSDKTPQVGSIKPEADTEKVLAFITSVFVFWLETKGIRVGSLGQLDSSNLASGISKIIDEMDTYELRKKSCEWFTKDEQELWNEKLPAIHNYWIKTGMLQDKNSPGILPEGVEMDIVVEFEKPMPMLSRAEELANIEKELNMGTLDKRRAIKKLHPEMEENDIEEILGQTQSLSEMVNNGMDQERNSTTV
jgi:hypothetical protein